MPAYKYTLRPARPSDLDALVAVHLSAFHESPLNTACFPASDPSSLASHRSMLADKLAEIVVATAHPVNDGITDGTSEQDGQIVGLVRWVRQPAGPPPRPIFTNDMYPPTGNQDLARRFFQANADVSGRVVAGRPVWHLSLMMVRREWQGRGVGAELMRYGVEQVDAEGWMAYTNASPAGRPLYEKFGFETVECSDFGGGVKTAHMARPARAKE